MAESNQSMGVERRAGVAGGEPVIAGTRIPVWLLEQALRLGLSDEEVLRAYPSLRAAYLARAWAYVSEHREEIERQIAGDEPCAGTPGGFRAWRFRRTVGGWRRAAKIAR